MSNPLEMILSRWETTTPSIGAAEALGPLQPVFESLQSQSILRPSTPAAAIGCSDCGHRCQVSYITNQAGVAQGFINCPGCGIAHVPANSLERWEINSTALLTAAFRELKLDLHERVPGHLWQVGKATWAGRSREVWFARCYRRDSAAPVIEQLGRRPKSVLFTPTEVGAGAWHKAAGNLTLALESALSWEGDAFWLDVDHVEGRLVDAGFGGGQIKTPPKKKKKRGDRVANIELLEKELIEHLRSAKDHAYASKHHTGAPKLLPRPTRKALGERVGLPPYEVTRCFRDKTAKDLRKYWEIAGDLYQVMDWEGPISKGRKQ